MSYAEQYDPDDGIAIIGMAGRFPGARDVDELWRNIVAGRESIARFTRDELEPSFPEDMAERAEPGYVLARGILDDVDRFDEGFFGFSPAEAALLDPQHRLFLQAAWAALEHAGHDPAAFGGLIGVYAGATANSYYLNNLLSRRDVTGRLGLLTTQMANQGHYIATRTAYKLDLRGPALNILTACSTSLVAVCTAVQALQAFQCDMALAGGVSITLPQRRGYLHQEGSILSPDGHCRAFDAEAAGTVFGNGLGIVVLRRLREALDAGDTVYAVIKGAALNNDGHEKLSFTAPGVEGQAAVIAMAQALAGIDPQTIGYIEAHGTGTALGDPIEVAGLTQAFRAGGAQGTGTCALGSLKTQIGHLDAAAGVAGLIRATLAVHHGILPPTLHFQSPNPRLELERSPFVVHDSARPWPAGRTPRRAGVSSFGVGGTNAHVVLEQCPARPAGGAGGVPGDPAALAADGAAQLLVLSARDASALDRATEGLRRHLEALPQASGEVPALADVAHTLQSGRHPFGLRRAWACTDLDNAVALLSRPLPPPKQAAGRLAVAFLFPGQGAQQAGLGRGLYDTEPVFRDEIDACAERLREPLGGDLREWLFPAPQQLAEAQQHLSRTAVTQPALLALQLALARLWSSWGIAPAALFGHSVGEYAAACVGGTFTRDDVLLLVAHRARLMQQMPAGAMLAVRASVEQLRGEIGDGVELAARNAPTLTILSGSLEAVGRVQERLDRCGIAHRRVATSHAFHSAMMEPVAASFEALVQRTPRRAPRLPWISGLTGRPVTADQACSPAYWARQLREPVQCVDALAECLASGAALLEVGPGDGLTRLARQHPLHDRSPAIVASLRLQATGGGVPAHVAERQSLLAAAGQLWCAGAAIDWPALHTKSRRRVPLPTYPFARHRHWVEPLPAQTQHPGPSAFGTAAGELGGAGAAADAPALPPPSPPPSPPPAAGSAGAGPGAVSAGPVPVAQGHAPPAGPGAAPPGATFEYAVRPGLQARLQALFGELAGIEPAQVSTAANFLELGLDSLLLTQASQALARQFGVRVPMRRLLEDCTTIDALAAELGPQLPPEPAATPPAPDLPLSRPAPQGVAATLAGPVATPAGLPSHWLDLFAQQLALMGQQLAMIRGERVDPPRSSWAPAPLAEAPGAPGAPPRPATVPTSAAPASAGSLAASAEVPREAGAVAPPAFGPYRPPSSASAGALPPEVAEELARFAARYGERTAASKRWTQEHRAQLADPRSVAGYRQAWKELVYPIVTVRSAGSRLWDLDGHEYIDVTNGFGMILFGHNPPFVREAVQRQLDAGYEIGPQTVLAGDVAQALCAMVGMERAAFCSTGSEAVMAAIRLARTVTGRERIVVFEGAYHGIFDEVLVRPGRTAPAPGEVPRAVPVAPGIPPSMVSQVTVLPYGDAQSLRTIQALGPELAAVLVEPVQSRRPELQPRDFLHELRRLTAASGTALVFDEVVTGFRVHPGGAQAVFGVRADIATYGKVVGGGLPIGVVAGSAQFLDALDGGGWRFGDDSAPQAGVTFFAGTFVRHPLALAAARAVLKRLESEGPALQRELNQRTTRLVESLRRTAADTGAPLQVEHFSSWFCLRLPAELPLASLFFPALRLRGIHAWEGRPCFLTTAHGDDELRQITDAVRDVLLEMQRCGFLPPGLPAAATRPAAAEPPVTGARRGRDREGREAWFVPDPDRPGKYLQILDGPVPHD